MRPVSNFDQTGTSVTKKRHVFLIIMARGHFVNMALVFTSHEKLVIIQNNMIKNALM